MARRAPRALRVGSLGAGPVGGHGAAREAARGLSAAMTTMRILSARRPVQWAKTADWVV